MHLEIKAKIALKIKTFMWLIGQNNITTKDNQIRRKWQEDGSCSFCLEHETIEHLFFWLHHGQIIWVLPVAQILAAQYS